MQLYDLCQGKLAETRFHQRQKITIDDMRNSLTKFNEFFKMFDITPKKIYDSMQAMM